MKKLITTCTALAAAFLLTAQTAANFWTAKTISKTALLENGVDGNLPEHYLTFDLDLDAMVNYLRNAPEEFTPEARNASFLLQLPQPDGTMETFAVWNSPVMEAGLAERYPMIKTFAGRSLQAPHASVRFGYSLEGFHAIMHRHETSMIDFQGGAYLNFWQKNRHSEYPFQCGVQHELTEEELTLNTGSRGVDLAVDLHTYRLAIATTAEYSTSSGGTPATVLSAVTEVINQVNAVFERENAIRLVLIANTDQTFFFPPNNADPFTNADLPACLDENPGVLNAAYGVDGYDIGHVFGTQNSGGTVGLAGVATVCNDSQKARGGSNKLSGQIYETAVHEFGHQFSALHNFNFCDGMNESETTGYEPGGGSSIMCYSGACAGNSVQGSPDNYFHVNSLERMFDFSRDPNSGGSCAQVVQVDNNAPVAVADFPDGLFIPISTPLELSGTATDGDGDDMVYNWEQYDLGVMSVLGTPQGNAPLFRSLIPGASSVRTLPNLNNLVNNLNNIREVLPTINRPVTFRFTARDNNAEAGAWGFDQVAVTATATAGPFRVFIPNAANIFWEVGQYQEVTWDVSNTTNDLVNCQFVNIRLSLDGGFTYPLTLLTATPNDGSAFVVVPDAVTTTARIRVEASNNIFFDISNTNFNITPATVAGFAFLASPEYGNVCVPEAFLVDVETASLLNFSEPITLSATGLPTGATATFSPNPVNPGGNSQVTLDFTNVTLDGDFEVIISGAAAGVDQQNRVLSLNVIYNDFSALQLTAPADGASGVSSLPQFGWTTLPNALAYDIQLSASPTFNPIIDEAFGISGNTFTPDVTLEDNTVYYWRVAASNECGTGDWGGIASFKTVSQTCQSVASTGANVPISGSGTPTVSKVINIPQSGTISDVNVTKIKGNHTAVAHLEFRLKNPAGEAVVLASGLVCGSNQFNFGFDGQSPLTSIPCPPNNSLLYQPADDLAAFNGGNSQGDWTLEIEVINSDGEGGTFESWSMEYCASSAPSNPFVLKNETLPVPPLGTRLVYNHVLEASDADNAPSELTFTIITPTAHGFISKNGTTLGVGGQFTMLDVNQSSIEYTNTNGAATTDFFTFTVSDSDGGFFGTPKFNIVIDPDAPPSGTNDAGKNSRMRVYPNPASEFVTLEFLSEMSGNAEVSLLNLQGQTLFNRTFDGVFQQLQLPLKGLPAGAYLLQVKTPEGVFLEKLILE